MAGKDVAFDDVPVLQKTRSHVVLLVHDGFFLSAKRLGFVSFE